MSVQRARMRDILAELRRRGVFTVVGGPWVTVQEDYFRGMADTIFVGEAEETWPRFLEEWADGSHKARYEQLARTDMTTVPVPRFDRLRMSNYAFGSIQFSRGCPFTCEFCDIIVTFGRRSRLKTDGQVTAELSALLDVGMRVVFIVDDNLIGNKKAIKPILREVVTWQEARGYPLIFFTEASLDLAEDLELLQLMAEAGIVAVFVGIETPSEASLRETKKIQNLHKAASLVQRVWTIQEAGLEVWSGMIVGFDADDASIFVAQKQFLAEARIGAAMVGMLNAIPKTPLHARLDREGRLDHADLSAHGTNVIPLRMQREELRAGYVRLMGELYTPAAYFARLESLYIAGRIPTSTGHGRYWRRHPWRGLVARSVLLAGTVALYVRLMRKVPPTLRQEYTRRMWRMLKARPDPVMLFTYLTRCAMHFHFHTVAREMMGEGQGRLANTI
jgi:radical SAM superfamily enzyme YgiQ (UPF0313 family)